MNMPPLAEPERYGGLYVFDFGTWTAVGYTAEEIAILLESETYGGGKVYKIQRAYPDGRMELRGVSARRFQLESGMFFSRSELERAREDLAALRAAAKSTPPPCRAYVHLVDRPASGERERYVTALVYPAEYDDAVAQWLLAIGFAGGDQVEGGISHVTNYYADEKRIIERHQLWSRPTIPARSADEVLASVRRAVQR